MRELKFRAWLDEYKQYLYFGGDFKEQTGRWGKGRCTLAGDNHIAELYANEDNSNMFYQVHKVKCIEQYTGLNDKNGKEIYEGDIVLVANHGRTPFAVIYREGDCCFVANNEFIVDYIHMFKSMPHCYEVIGNIHENPELLEHKG